MTPKWQKLASLAQEICILWFQFFGAVFIWEMAADEFLSHLGENSK